MQQVLNRLEIFYSLYFDDVVIFSIDWGHHLGHYRDAVLARLTEYGLSVKSSKCCWGSTQFEFMGFVVGHSCLGIILEFTSLQNMSYRR